MFFVTSAPAADVAEFDPNLFPGRLRAREVLGLVGTSSCEFDLDRFGYFSVVEQP